MKRAALLQWVGSIQQAVVKANSGLERCAGHVEECSAFQSSDVDSRLEEVEQYCRFVLGSTRKLRKVLSYGQNQKRGIARA